ncbi:TIGR02391 family protein [Methylobacterium sp. E-041]|uniref:TIGR02391 family protein n=1 Tax=Methylobacterium sp. E-041 TaxID=2836573 RepID=UPI001FB8E240|nr:TIGR02391 family protein [Methylobacterium sp. E-041]MCJ2108127.1 TIGR02391 family protein [Methylobacterium sp. E-041]
MHFEGLPEEADVLLALEPDEIGLRLLPTLARPSMMPGIPLALQTFLGFAFAPVQYADGRSGFRGPYPAERHPEVKQAIAEAWAWLEREGLLMPVLVNLTGGGEEFHPTNRQVSRKGRRIAAQPQLGLSTRMLPKEALHPAIREDVWSLFHRGKYDTAVFEAMKAVEIAVREAANLPATDVGTHLMRTAFDPKKGNLRDKKATLAEQEGRSSLFAGAMAAYKNPQSHRRVALDDPDEAFEIIMLANHLLRIVSDCNSVFS